MTIYSFCQVISWYVWVFKSLVIWTTFIIQNCWSVWGKCYDHIIFGKIIFLNSIENSLKVFCIFLYLVYPHSHFIIFFSRTCKSYLIFLVYEKLDYILICWLVFFRSLQLMNYHLKLVLVTLSNENRANLLWIPFTYVPVHLYIQIV